jgi:tetratricopeptide (TPR) repeat protein
MKKLYFTLALSIFIIVCCTSGNRNKLIVEIQRMEKNGDEYNPQYLDSLNVLYESFVIKFPKDSLAPRYLLSAAQSTYSRGTQEGQYLDQAILKLNKLINAYPDAKEVEAGMFLIANIYENNKNDTIKAKEYYSLYIAKYPAGEYTESVKSILEGNLGKSAEEWIKKFQKEGKIDSTLHIN